eukprot:3066951-Rhodomonas_salina.2
MPLQHFDAHDSSSEPSSVLGKAQSTGSEQQLRLCRSAVQGPCSSLHAHQMLLPWLLHALAEHMRARWRPAACLAMHKRKIGGQELQAHICCTRALPLAARTAEAATLAPTCPSNEG